MQYLCKKVSQVTLGNGETCWAFRSSQYIQNAVNNVEYYLQKKWDKLPARENYPWSRKYRSETDVSPELIPTKATYFQQLISVLIWIVDYGRADINMETYEPTYMMSSPREVHLKEVFHMFDFNLNPSDMLTK